MTIDSEDRIRVLLETAAPEPPRTLDGADLREAADDAPDGVVPLRRAPRSTTLSVVFAVAAVLAVALTLVSLIVRSGRGTAPPAGGVHPSTAPAVRKGPARCSHSDLVLQDGNFRHGSTGRGTTTLTISSGSQRRCTLPGLPTIRVTFDGAVLSQLTASSYRPALPVVVGPNGPAKIIVSLRAVDATCNGLGVGRTRIAFVFDGFTYAFPLHHVSGCKAAIASAVLAP